LGLGKHKLIRYESGSTIRYRSGKELGYESENSFKYETKRFICWGGPREEPGKDLET
jgi:hypothetical protein